MDPLTQTRTLIKVSNCQSTVSECRRCELATVKAPIPLAIPALETQVAVLLDHPDKLEWARHRGYVSPPSNLVRKELSSLGMSSPAWFYAASCGGKLSKTTLDICRVNVIEQWRALPVKYVLVCGVKALSTIMPNHTRKTANKGIRIHDKIIWPIAHPAYPLYTDPASMWEWRESITRFVSMVLGIDEPVTTCAYCDKDSTPTCKTHADLFRKDSKWKHPQPSQERLF